MTVKIPYDSGLFPSGASEADLIALSETLGGGIAAHPQSSTDGTILTVTLASLELLQAAIPIVAIDSFDAAPPLVLAGATSVLSWTTSHASTCIIDQSIGSVSTNGSTVPITISSTTTFQITCQGLGGPANQLVTATVGPQVAITSFSATPTTIVLGESTMLSWNADNATSCSIDNGIGALADTSGSLGAAPEATLTYELSCDGAGGPVTQQASVTVELPVEIDSFIASAVLVSPGASVDLSWVTSEATSCEINPGAINATPTDSGDTTVSVSNSTAYTLTCQGPGGPAEFTRGVWVPGEVADNMSPIPAGCFDMGPPSDPTNVCLGAFLIGIYEITNVEYILCMEAGFCKAPFKDGSFDDPGNENKPIVSISWFDSFDYCIWRYDGRLPTDSEWEYAARGGLSGLNYPWGDTVTSGDANCCGFGGDFMDVGQFPPNGYGLYDVIGSVWEWVDTDATGARKYVLGGAYGTSASWSTVWYRGTAHAAGDWYDSLGFRCAI